MKFLWWRKDPPKEEEVEVPLVVYNPYRNLLKDNGRDAFGRYFKSEIDFMVDGSYSENEDYQALRKEAVKFFAKYSKSPEFDALIPYKAMTYFDRFISRHEIPNIIESAEENRTLFLLCCLAIAWKLRTNKFDYPKFLKKRTWSFEARDVRRMELYICGTLDWKMRTLSPIFFAEYFVPLLRLPPEFPSPRRSVHELIIRSQAEIEYTEYRPSVLAASAVITVSSMMYNAQADILRSRIQTSEFLNVASKLWPLYLIINKPEAEDSSSSDYEPPTHERSSSSDSSDEREPLTEQRLETGETSAAASRRPGKEPAVSEFELEQEEIGKDLVEAFDELMDFKLGWTDEADDDDDEKREAQGPAAIAAALVQKVNGCCRDFVHRVNGTCTIL
ncbi:G1/S-specific cyclin D [Handroanthus impetiginosus]|uniref:G1/S-specific cyclin D n=1 Tax=Handroanthus impetiginosus TaxID=429701 RepID=A0A2G9GM16_9LAMI|nr:G1/S-specific cyclin D [Handroanthus impetiginosus]